MLEFCTQAVKKMSENDIIVQIVEGQLDSAIGSKLHTSDFSMIPDGAIVTVTYWMKRNDCEWEYKEHKMNWEMVKLLYGKEVPLWK